jgi:hypothetical protein
MAAKKKVKAKSKSVKAKSKSRKQSAKRSVKALSPRKRKSVKGGLLPPVKVASPTNLNPGSLVSGADRPSPGA